MELWNKKAGSNVKEINKYTTSIVSVEGEPGVDYGDN